MFLILNSPEFSDEEKEGIIQSKMSAYRHRNIGTPDDLWVAPYIASHDLEEIYSVVDELLLLDLTNWEKSNRINQLAGRNEDWLPNEGFGRLNPLRDFLESLAH